MGRGTSQALDPFTPVVGTRRGPKKEEADRNLIYSKNNDAFSIIETWVRPRDGKLHRELGPAKVTHLKALESTQEEYYLNGVLYRRRNLSPETNVKLLDEYYDNKGRYHREDGPARTEVVSTSTEVRITEDITHGLAPETEITAYYKHGCLHREDGPAVLAIGPDGKQSVEAYSENGKLHREDGPALILRYADGRVEQCYYRKGKRHREDGPALTIEAGEYDRVYAYYNNGKLHRTDGPAQTIYTGGASTINRYYKHGKLHRVDEPAVIEERLDGTTTEYHVNGMLHRNGGPAVIETGSDGFASSEAYFQNGVEQLAPSPLDLL